MRDLTPTICGDTAFRFNNLDFLATEYPGGTAALMQYMNDNMAYPEEAKKKRRRGRYL